jgi:hypothetical protein
LEIDPTIAQEKEIDEAMFDKATGEIEIGGPPRENLAVEREAHGKDQLPWAVERVGLRFAGEAEDDAAFSNSIYHMSPSPLQPLTKNQVRLA